MQTPFIAHGLLQYLSKKYGQHCPIFAKFLREKLDGKQFRHKIPTSSEAA